MFIKCFRNVNDNKYYVPITVYSYYLERYLKINFLVDTGATLTQISWPDAIIHGIVIRNLPSTNNYIVEGIGGSVRTYPLPNNLLMFRASNGRFDIPIDNLKVMDFQTIDGKDCPYAPSLLGIDVLHMFDFLPEKKSALLRRNSNY